MSSHDGLLLGQMLKRMAAPYGLLLAVLLTACSSPSEPVAAPSVTTTTQFTALQGEGSGSAALTLQSSTSTSTTTTTPPNVAPTTPGEVVERLARVEAALRLGPANALALGHGQQTMLRALGRNPDWVPQVLEALPDDAERIERLLSAGQSSVDSLPPPLEAIPAWTITNPRPLVALRALYDEAEEVYGVGWYWLAAINLVETRLGRIEGASGAGAQGPMQFLPSTWDEFGSGGDIGDDRDAILAAARFLVAHGAPDDMASAVRRYNPSDAYVDAVTTYADIMAAEPWTFHGFYGWRVYVRTTEGTLWIPTGYSAEEPVPVAEFLSSTEETTS